MSDDLNKRLCEKLGICWHEQIDHGTLQCKHCGHEMLLTRNPDFITDPLSLLRIMREREDWIDFVYKFFLQPDAYEEARDIVDLLLDQTGVLARAVDEWPTDMERVKIPTNSQVDAFFDRNR